MSHPPIPPNCTEFFDKINRREVFIFQINGTSIWWFLEPQGREDPLSKPAKRLIASVARCAWLDEEKAYQRVSHIDDLLIQILSDMNRCSENAEAWRLWGLNV